MRRLVVLMLLAAVSGASLGAADAGASSARARAAKQRLTTFPSCARLVRYGRHYSRREQRGGGVFAPGAGLPTPVAAPTAQGNAPQAATPDVASDSSGTNVQEAGVDEPDIVKSDGTRIFAVSGGRLNAVDARAASPSLLGSIDLGTYGGDLLLAGKRALVIATDYGRGPVATGPPTAGIAQPDIAFAGPPRTVITEVDVSDPTAMRIVRTETVDGNYVSARQNGAIARIVLSTPPAALGYGTAARRLRTRTRGWLPSATLVNRATGAKRTRRLVSCAHVRRPHVFSGLDALTVLTVDMKKGLPAVDADSIMSDGQTVYASDDSLYVATQKFVAQPDGANEPPPPLATAIHRFDISDPARTTYRSSGEVSGYVLNQFALSEYRGVLRVASTDSPVWWPGGEQAQPQSSVTTLKDVGGALLPLGRVGGLGRGEQIQAVRFLGDAGYVVTFRRTDPLFTIDLSQPAEPRVAGELKLLGYSAYLHPVGNGLLVGVGQDATASGRQLGTQLSLFDVSDLARPQRLSQRRIGSSSSSEVEYDHHAFLYWPATRLAVIPVDIFDDSGGDPFLGAIGFRIGSTRIDEVGRITHQDGQYPSQVRRAVVVGDRLFTVSDLGVKASTLSSLADQSFVAFPVQNQPGPTAGDPGSAPPAPAR